ncbi:hypothetical protein BH10ACI1_BH10ACI1_08670 [soil metagenome]
MNRIVCLCVILLCSISFAFAQGGRGRTRQTKKPVVKKIDPQIAEAEKAWIPFWKEFTVEIKNRDKESLKMMIAEDYNGSFCDYEPSNKREGFFCRGWSDIYADFFNKVPFSSRYVLSKIVKAELDDGTKILRGWDSKNPEWGGYSFEYRSNGKWYLVAFVAGCTA